MILWKNSIIVLIGGEYVRSLVSPHYTLAARTPLFAVEKTPNLEN